MSVTKSFFLLSGCAFFLASCSTTTVRDTLGYTPIIEQQGKNHISLQIEEFEDGRSEGQEIGKLKNLYGITVIKVTTGEDIPSWIREALRIELANAGYSTIEFGHSDGYRIEGKVNKVFADAYFNINGCVSVEISLKKGEEILFHKDYEFRNDQSVKFLDEKSSKVEYATVTETLKYDLQKVCKSLVADVDQYLLNSSRIK